MQIHTDMAGQMCQTIVVVTTVRPGNRSIHCPYLHFIFVFQTHELISTVKKPGSDNNPVSGIYQQRFYFQFGRFR